MIHRPPARSTKARKRRYRDRVRRGALAVTIEVDARIVDMLTRLDWLPARDVHDRLEIAAAIERLLADAAG
jgi:hypothetical protein